MRSANVLLAWLTLPAASWMRPVRSISGTLSGMDLVAVCAASMAAWKSPA